MPWLTAADTCVDIHVCITNITRHVMGRDAHHNRQTIKSERNIVFYVYM